MEEGILKNLFDTEFERQKQFIAGLFLLGEREKLNLFKWFCLGFEAKWNQPIQTKVLSPEEHKDFLEKLQNSPRSGTIIMAVNDCQPSVFVYSWRGVQQHTMIILADSREEADQLFKEQEPDVSFYVTMLRAEGTPRIIYNN